MIFGGAALRLLYRTGGAVGAAIGRRSRDANRAREYRMRNSRNICAVDSGFAVD
jgi:hypothetical protein